MSWKYRRDSIRTTPDLSRGSFSYLVGHNPAAAQSLSAGYDAAQLNLATRRSRAQNARRSLFSSEYAPESNGRLNELAQLVENPDLSDPYPTHLVTTRGGTIDPNVLDDGTISSSIPVFVEKKNVDTLHTWGTLTSVLVPAGFASDGCVGTMPINVSTTLPAVAAFAGCVYTSQGSQATQHTGRKVHLSNISCNWTLIPPIPPTPAPDPHENHVCSFRLVVIQDLGDSSANTGVIGKNPLPYNVFAATYTDSSNNQYCTQESPMNLSNRARYVVLHNEIFHPSSDKSSSYAGSFFKPLNSDAYFLDDGGPVTTGNIFIYACVAHGRNTYAPQDTFFQPPTLTVMCRIRFTDS